MQVSYLGFSDAQARQRALRIGFNRRSQVDCAQRQATGAGKSRRWRRRRRAGGCFTSCAIDAVSSPSVVTRVTSVSFSRDIVAERNRMLADELPRPISIGTGIHVGKAILGELGIASASC